MNHTEPDYYTVSQAAARLGVSRVSVWRWIRDGYLPAARLGPRTTRIKREDVDRALAQIQSADPRPGLSRSREASDASSPRPPTEHQASDHAVQFYESDAFLVDAVADFIGAGLRAGGAGIVIATKLHRDGIEAQLLASGFDVTLAVPAGRYTALDAAETLRHFMVDAAPHPERFAEAIGGLVSRAAKGRRRVRVFGELAALLAANGNYPAAVRLEELWNELRRNGRFSLLCAYPIARLGADTLTSVLGDVCASHSRVIPAESYTRLPTEKGRLQAIVALQSQTHWLQAQVAEQQRAEEGLRLSLAIERDARQEAIITQRQRDELLSVAAQEMKHPLASLSLQAQQALVRLGRESRLHPERVEKAMEAIAGQPAELPRLIGQLVDFSRLEARKLTLQPRWTDLTNLIEAVVTEMRPHSSQHAISIAAPDSIEILIDAERTKRVLESLLDNAIKASPGGGTIDVALSAVGSGAVELSVRDRGTGLAPEKREALFERIHESDRRDAGPGLGLGLGLYVSRQIIERHGGELFAEFPPDGGARFVVRLPSGREEPVERTAAD